MLIWDTFEETPGKNDKKTGSRKSTYFHDIHPAGAEGKG